MFPNNWTTRENLALKYFRINYKPKIRFSFKSFRDENLSFREVERFRDLLRY